MRIVIFMCVLQTILRMRILALSYYKYTPMPKFTYACIIILIRLLVHVFACLHFYFNTYAYAYSSMVYLSCFGTSLKTCTEANSRAKSV